MALRACRLCIFHDASNAAKGQPGVCRRYPPQMIIMPQQDALGRTGVAAMATFPAVQPDAWCGEFSLLMGMNAQ